MQDSQTWSNREFIFKSDRIISNRKIFDNIQDISLSNAKKNY